MVERVDLSETGRFKFVRSGEQIVVGSPQGYHRDLVAKLGLERPQIKSPSTDMGLITRETGCIVVSGSSIGYRWPPIDNPQVTDPIRAETVRQLQAVYPDLEVRSS